MLGISRFVQPPASFRCCLGVLLFAATYHDSCDTLELLEGGCLTCPVVVRAAVENNGVLHLLVLMQLPRLENKPSLDPCRDRLVRTAASCHMT